MIVINSSTRQFNIPGADLVFGVESDSGSVIKEFQCPRYVGNNLDLTGCFIRMNYRNANGEIDSYLVPEVTVDGDNVVFGWELSPHVTMYKGNVSFVMCVVGPDTKVKWHTTLGRGQVLEGLEPDSAMIEEGTADVVAALVAMVEAQTEAVADTGAEWVRNVQSEGTDQIIAVQTAAREAQSDAVAQIEAKGVNTLATIPEDYTALSEAVDTLNRTRGAAIVCEAAGETVVVSDSSNLPMQGLRVFGKTTQATTTGAQMFDKNAAVVGMLEEDGSVTVDGAYVTSDFIPITPKTAYHQTEKESVRAKYYDANKNPLSETWDVQIAYESTFTTFENAYFIRVTVSVKHVDSFMLNLGTVGLPYEPYTGGQPSPSPDYPQELVSLEPVVTVCGKNLLKNTAKTTTHNGITFNVNDDGSIIANGTATDTAYLVVSNDLSYLEIGKTYKMSGCPSGGDVSTYFIQVNGTWNGDYGNGGYFEYKEIIKNYAIYVKAGVTVTNLVFHPMICCVEYTDNAYEPYKAPQTVELTHTLSSIPAKYAAFANYTDSEGVRWTVDKVDFEQGLYVRHMNQVEFTGDEDWADSSSYPAYTIELSPQSIVGLCSHLKSLTVAELQNGEQGVYLEWSKYAIVQVKERFATLAEFKTFLAEQYANGTPFTLVYSMETPIETPLSETEIAAYRALHSNYPNTTVLNDTGAHMVVKYAADTKLYIDNKIAALVGG